MNPQRSPTPPRGTDAAAPASLGRYDVLHRIASGGMASVYLGRVRGAAGFERVVAIKCCHPFLRGEREFATMFLDEARLAARIHHPNVVATLDVGDDAALYLVMEYIEGDRLSGLVRAAAERGERLPAAVTARVMLDVLTGLHAAHELRADDGAPLGIVHRDVSPQNVLVGTDGVARITDFGIAKAAARATVTREGQLKGKLAYMAPEQFDNAPATRRVDVFAAGVVLWEALTARRLFHAETEAASMGLILRGRVAPPSSVASEVPAGLDAVVLKALARDPAARFVTAAEFAEALEECGVAPASPRRVGALVSALVGDALAQRRALLAALRARDEAGASRGSSPGVARPAPALVPVDPEDDATTQSAREIPPSTLGGRAAAVPAGRARGSRRAALVGVAAVAGAAALGAVVLVRAHRGQSVAPLASAPRSDTSSSARSASLPGGTPALAPDPGAVAGNTLSTPGGAPPAAGNTISAPGNTPSTPGNNRSASSSSLVSPVSSVHSTRTDGLSPDNHHSAPQNSGTIALDHRIPTESTAVSAGNTQSLARHMESRRETPAPRGAAHAPTSAPGAARQPGAAPAGSTARPPAEPARSAPVAPASPGAFEPEES